MLVKGAEIFIRRIKKYHDAIDDQYRPIHEMKKRNHRETVDASIAFALKIKYHQASQCRPVDSFHPLAS